MAQNKYDEPDFFAQYATMARSVGGLPKAGEWYAFQSLLPNFQEKRVLDLGCGFGWHCRYAREHGASSVIGIDLSEKMLARAKEINADPGIEYRRSAIETVDFAAGEFDVVISSLAFHYIEHFDRIVQKIARWLVAGGEFVFSVEHPIFSACPAQDWCYGDDGKPLHWPVDNYRQEGMRQSQWLTGDVIKFHRSIERYVNTLLDGGFQLLRLLEPQPSPAMLAENPGWLDECRRPMFLLIAARRNENEICCKE